MKELIVSISVIFSACMISMSVIVMGMKGRDYLLELKQDEEKIYQSYLNGIIINGYYRIGWALILAIVAALVNFISFGFFILEYKDMTDLPRPTKVWMLSVELVVLKHFILMSAAKCARIRALHWSVSGKITSTNANISMSAAKYYVLRIKEHAFWTPSAANVYKYRHSILHVHVVSAANMYEYKILHAIQCQPQLCTDMRT